jgi:hypothetical protein
VTGRPWIVRVVLGGAVRAPSAWPTFHGASQGSEQGRADDCSAEGKDNIKILTKTPLWRLGKTGQSAPRVTNRQGTLASAVASTVALLVVGAALKVMGWADKDNAMCSAYPLVSTLPLRRLSTFARVLPQCIIVALSSHEGASEGESEC